MAIKITIPRKKLFYIYSVEALPTRGGIYMFYNEDQGELLYIGKASNLRQRVKMHLRDTSMGPNRFGGTGDVKHNFRWIETFCVDCPMERDIYETYLINTLKPFLNVGKVYSYKTSRYIDKYKSEEYLKFQEEEEERRIKVFPMLEL